MKEKRREAWSEVYEKDGKGKKGGGRRFITTRENFFSANFSKEKDRRINKKGKGSK